MTSVNLCGDVYVYIVERYISISTKLSLVVLLTDPVCHIFILAKKWECCVQTSVKPLKWRNILQCWSTEVVKSCCLQYRMLCLYCESVVYAWIAREVMNRQYECNRISLVSSVQHMYDWMFNLTSLSCSDS